MEQGQGSKNYLNLDLVNVMYGVVASYGFYFIDRAISPADYLRFIFAYVILFIDWVYTHHTYTDQEYKKPYLILDLGILFLFSRLLATSTSGGSVFYGWLSIIFIIYFIWDYIMRNDNVRSGYDWISCLASDFAGVVIFFVFWLVLTNYLFLNDYTFITIAAVVIYAVITIAWFRKPVKNTRLPS